MQEVHVVLQDIHHHVLEIRINGEHDGVACLRLLDYFVGNLHAVGIPGDLPGASLAAKRAFYSGGADDVVHGVACALQLSVLFRGYRADCPSQVGRGGSVKVDTVPALGYLHARHKRGKLLQLQHGVTGQPGSDLVFVLIVEIHQIHLVAHSGDVPPHGLLVLVGNVVVFVQRIHAVVNGGVNAKPQTHFKGIHRVLAVSLELIRLRASDGQGLIPLLALVGEHGQNAVNNLVLGACDKAGFLEIHAAIQLIGVEYLSGAVGDLSPCRLNILLRGIGILRHGKVFSAVSYLYLQQAESAQERSRDYKGGKDCRPEHV